MGEFLPFATDVTPKGLLGLVFVMVMMGWLVPLRLVRGRLADKDAIIAAQAREIAVLTRNNDQLLRGNGATVHVLESLPPAISGEPNDPEVV